MISILLYRAATRIARRDFRMPTDTSAALHLHRRGGGSACPAGMSPPGGTGARQEERSGEFAAFTTSPDLSVVIKQGSAGRCKPLPQCLPRERGRCPSAHTGADEVLDLSSGRFVNRPYDAAERGSGGDQRSPLRRDGIHAYPPVTVAGSGDSPL